MPQSKHVAGVNAALFKALGHPLRGQIMVVLDERQASPKELHEMLGDTLDNVSYHVRELRKAGLIELVDTDTRRGGTQHIYKASARPILHVEAWEKLVRLVRELNSVWVGQILLGDMIEAMEARTFDARPGRTMIRMPLVVDEQGWKDLEPAGAAYLEALHQIQAESAGRLVESDEEGINAMAGALAFEMPAR